MEKWGQEASDSGSRWRADVTSREARVGSRDNSRVRDGERGRLPGNDAASSTATKQHGGHGGPGRDACCVIRWRATAESARTKARWFRGRREEEEGGREGGGLRAEIERRGSCCKGAPYSRGSRGGRERRQARERVGEAATWTRGAAVSVDVRVRGALCGYSCYEGKQRQINGELRHCGGVVGSSPRVMGRRVGSGEEAKHGRQRPLQEAATS